MSNKNLRRIIAIPLPKEEDMEHEVNNENSIFIDHSGVSNNFNLQKSQLFRDYEMYFLQKPVSVKLQEPIELIQTTFNYKVKFTSMYDTKELNAIFKNFADGIKIGNSDYYLNGKNVILYDDSFPGQIIQYTEGQKWILTISIQGYKLGANNHPSPIWRITEARLSNW